MAQWVKDNPDTPQPAAADLAVIFYSMAICARVEQPSVRIRVVPLRATTARQKGRGESNAKQAEPTRLSGFHIPAVEFIRWLFAPAWSSLACESVSCPYGQQLHAERAGGNPTQNRRSQPA